MDKKEIERFCRHLEAKIQEENADIDIKFINQKDMWFTLSCEYYDNQKNDYIELTSKVDVNLEDTEKDIAENIKEEINNLLNKKKMLENMVTK